MQTLSQRLRQLRSWQGLTLASVAGRAQWYAGGVDQDIKKQARFESGGEMLHKEYGRYVSSLSAVYGISEKTLERLLDAEYEWRVTAGSTTPCTYPEFLPRAARYAYKPLPEVAHNLFQDGFVIVDLETTGKDPHRFTGACEITLLDTDGVVLLNSLINPGFHMPVEARLIHGITDEMVKDAPTFREIGHQIAKLIDGRTVVIYNAGFDGWLLDRLIIESGIDMPDFQEWCLMKAYADFYRVPGKYGNYAWQSLSAACAQQGVESDGEAHRTLADTTMAWKLLQKAALGQCVTCEDSYKKEQAGE